MIRRPEVGMRLRSNDGTGPLRARIVAIYADTSVKLERWHPRTPDRTTPFCLTVNFLRSRVCGWREDRTPEAAR